MAPNLAAPSGVGAAKTSRWEDRAWVPSRRRVRISLPRRIRLDLGRPSLSVGRRSARAEPTDRLLRAHPHSELAAATPATARQGLATPSSFHPGSEPVLIQTFPIPRSIGRLHLASPVSGPPSFGRCEAEKGTRILEVASRRKSRQKSRLTFPHPAGRISPPGASPGGIQKGLSNTVCVPSYGVHRVRTLVTGPHLRKGGDAGAELSNVVGGQHCDRPFGRRADR